jgi:superfamily II DNA/RNA helicase
MTFADLGLGPEILKAVEEAGYQRPTPIQEQAIPVILMGRDVLGVAQTGTGKTAGFTLPMIEILAGSRAKARMPRSLILAPTRELASQAAENFEIYGKYHRLTMAKLIGGESFVDQEKLLDRGVDVLIATPGRLIDLFDRGRILLNDVKVLVIDEADRMLDMGFIPDVERIVSLLPKIRQTLFFSATMAPEIRRLADAFLMNPKEISVTPSASTATTVEQFLIVCDEVDKREALRQLIRNEDVKNALIFCNRKRDVDILFRSLNKHGFDAVQLHGDMAQSARTETLERFKAGGVRLMVCSDVAARGIDISDLSHVFNFDVPHHSEDYIHRIGRTGRAGKQGRAFTIAAPEDGKAVAAIQQLTGQTVPRITLEGLAEQELDMEADGRRRGTGHGRDKRSKERVRDRKPRRKAEPPVSEPVAQETAPREEAPRDVQAPRSGERDYRAPRDGARDANRGDHRRDRDRPRRYRDDPEIGEMVYPDKVIGFGHAIPDFLARPVPLPGPTDKRKPGDADDGDHVVRMSADDADLMDRVETVDEPVERTSRPRKTAKAEPAPARAKAAKGDRPARNRAPRKAAAKPDAVSQAPEIAPIEVEAMSAPTPEVDVTPRQDAPEAPSEAIVEIRAVEAAATDQTASPDAAAAAPKSPQPKSRSRARKAPAKAAAPTTEPEAGAGDAPTEKAVKRRRPAKPRQAKAAEAPTAVVAETAADSDAAPAKPKSRSRTRKAPAKPAEATTVSDGSASGDGA